MIRRCTRTTARRGIALSLAAFPLFYATALRAEDVPPPPKLPPAAHISSEPAPSKTTNMPEIAPVMEDAPAPVDGLPPLPAFNENGESGNALDELFPPPPPAPAAVEETNPDAIFSLENIPAVPAPEAAAPAPVAEGELPPGVLLREIPPAPVAPVAEEPVAVDAVAEEKPTDTEQKPEEEKKETGDTAEKKADEKDADAPGEKKPEKVASKKPKPLPNYRTERLPETVYRKNYSRDNRHLPTAYYEDEYMRGLFAAVDRGDIKAMQAFMNEGVSIEVVDARGETPFMHAVRVGNLFSVQFLLSQGANSDAVDTEGRSALHIAATLRQPRIVEAVVGYNPKLIAQEDMRGSTPLVVAASVGDTGAMDALVRSGAMVNAANVEGRTALHAAARGGQAGAIEYLLSHGTFIDAMDKYGRTPLHYAARFGQASAAASLVRGGARTDLRDAQGYTAEALARASGYAQVSGVIISEEFRRSLVNAAPRTPVLGYPSAGGTPQPLR